MAERVLYGFRNMRQYVTRLKGNFSTIRNPWELQKAKPRSFLTSHTRCTGISGVASGCLLATASTVAYRRAARLWSPLSRSPWNCWSTPKNGMSMAVSSSLSGPQMTGRIFQVPNPWRSPESVKEMTVCSVAGRPPRQ